MEAFLGTRLIKLLESDSSSEASNLESEEDTMEVDEEVTMYIEQKYNEGYHFISEYVASVIPTYSIDEFKSHFRISRTSVNVSFIY